MARIKITSFGTKEYYNDEGDLHRDDGPAVIYPDGRLEWRINGVTISRCSVIGSYLNWPAKNTRRVQRADGLKASFEIGDRPFSERSIWPKL